MAFRFPQITDIEIKGVQDQFQCRLGEGTAVLSVYSGDDLLYEVDVTVEG